MKKKEEIKEWLLANCVDEDGDLDLMNLDFSDFDGDVWLSQMKVKKNLHQDRHEVGEDLNQYCQCVKGNFYNHKLDDDEKWVNCDYWRVQRVKKLKEVTAEELKDLGYIFKE